jgi:hypothetical protein
MDILSFQWCNTRRTMMISFSHAWLSLILWSYTCSLATVGTEYTSRILLVYCWCVYTAILHVYCCIICCHLIDALYTVILLWMHYMLPFSYRCIVCCHLIDACEIQVNLPTLQSWFRCATFKHNDFCSIRIPLPRFFKHNDFSSFVRHVHTCVSFCSWPLHRCTPQYIFIHAISYSICFLE